MTCTYFEEGALCRCRAVRGLLVPSLHERERYCTSQPALCPTQRLRELSGHPLDEESYYALWLAGEGGPPATRTVEAPDVYGPRPPA